jgi:pimeloyl-ACP methyl ester carboxylesterase
VAFEHQPQTVPRGQIVFLHGLEGSAAAGYVVSFAQEALVRGYGVHRLNLRTCGDTEELCETMYHSGLTGDTKVVLERLQERGLGPNFLVGFSLGGNVALKLAGELGATGLLASVCAISTPIDLAACVRSIDKPSNILYARRFLGRLRDRVRRKSKLTPHLYSTAGLDDVKTIWEFDDRFTAPLFGFGTAANYYATQSAMRYLDAIRIPTLVICAKDDPLVPFEIYRHLAFRNNPAFAAVGDGGGRACRLLIAPQAEILARSCRPRLDRRADFSGCTSPFDQSYIVVSISFIQHLDNVRDSLSLAVQANAARQLQHAPRIGCHDQRSFGGRHLLHLVLEDFDCHLVLNHVVDTGAAAAEIGHRHLPELQPRNRLQKFPGSLSNFLPVSQVAGILIGRDRLYSAHFAVEFDGRQELGHILHLGFELDRLLAISRIGA